MRLGIAYTLMLNRGLAPVPAIGASALVFCAAEHGFIGGLYEQLVDAGRAAFARGESLFALGSRCAA